MNKVLLLGASGLLGQNTLRLLLDEGHAVRAQVRRASSFALQHELLEISTFDPLCETELLRAAMGCQAIVNCIGTTSMSCLHLDDYLPANYRLPQLLVSVMEQAGITTLVHTSTANTIGHGTPSRHATEHDPVLDPFASSLYARSKAMGEQVVLDAATTHPDWHVVVLNPGFMIGPWDTKPSSGRLLLAAAGRHVMAAPCGGKAFVAVADVAQAAVNALTQGRNGARYLVVGKNLSIRELYSLQAHLLGTKQALLTLPRWLMLAAGLVGDVLRACGIATELSSNNVRQLIVREYYDGSLARHELNIAPTPIETAIKDFHQWRKHSAK